MRAASTINPQVLMADARVEQALARVGQARSVILPQVTGLVNGMRQAKDLRGSGIPLSGDPRVGPFNSFDARGRVSIELFDPQAIERLRFAQKGQELSLSERAKVRQDILALVATLYVQAKRSQQSARALKVVLKRDEQALAIAQVSFKQGSLSSLELKKAESDLAQSRYAYSRAGTQQLQSRLDLAAALKLPLDVPIDFVDDPSCVKDLAALTGSLEAEESPDVRVARAKLAEQEALTKQAKAAFFPKVSVVADYGRAGKSPDEGSNTYSMGLQTSIPIWEGGSQQSQLKEADAKLKESREDMEDALRQDQVKLLNARQALREARDLLKAKATQEQTALEGFKVVQDRLRLGQANVLQLAQARAVYASARDEFEEAEAYSLIALVSLTHAMGRLEQFVQ